MKKIEKLDIKEYQVPTNLETRGESKSRLLWATGVIDGMLDKLDELVERVNALDEPFIPGACNTQDIRKKR